jgi:hypothetical protein
MLLGFMNLKLPDFAKGSGRTPTLPGFDLKLKFACQAPIAANARVVRCTFRFFL